MTRPIVREYKGEGEFIDREMNDQEYNQHLKDIEQFEIKKAEAEAKEATRQAILNRLGLTANELNTILG